MLQQLPFVLFDPLSRKKQKRTEKGQVRLDSGMRIDHRGGFDEPLLKLFRRQVPLPVGQLSQQALVEEMAALSLRILFCREI